MAAGVCKAIFPIDAAAAEVLDGSHFPDPYDARAVRFKYFMDTANTAPEAEQLLLIGRINEILDIAEDQVGTDNPSFRTLYVSLFEAAKLSLIGANVSRVFLETALRWAEDGMLDERGAALKKQRMHELGNVALCLGLPLLALYALVRHALDGGGVAPTLALLDIDARTFSAFLLVWIGSFVGVWIAYGIRTPQFTIRDFRRANADFLVPSIRLVFVGLLAMLVALLLHVDFIDLKIGTLSFGGFASTPMVAFILGCLLGIGELALPAFLGKRSESLLKPPP